MTKRSMHRAGWAWPVLLLGLALAGCDSATAPEQAVEPRFNVERHQLHAVGGADGAGYLGAVEVGPTGAVIGYGPHRLMIPESAVASATIFEFWLLDGVIGMEMAATAKGSTVKNDVGAAGFAQPLLLTLSYESATRTVDATRLTIALQRADGTLEPVTSSVDASGKRVTGTLKHFSGYIIAD